MTAMTQADDAIAKFKALLESGMPIAKAKMKSRVYALIHQERLTLEQLETVRQISESFRIRKHTG